MIKRPIDYLSSLFLIIAISLYAVPIGATSTAPEKNKICEAQGNSPYVSLQEIMAGQTFMSEEAVTNISNDLRKPGFYKDEQTKTVKFCYDNGKSPFNKPFKVLLAPPGIVDAKNKAFKYVLVDGHHTIGGTLLGAKSAGANDNTIRNLTISVKVDEQYKSLPLDKFWQKIKEEHLVYTDQSGAIPARHVADVPNDDMRGFIEQGVVGCSESKPIKYNSTPDKTLWLRVGGDKVHASVPFIEFYISDALKSGGFNYKSGETINQEKVEEARKILIKNAQLLNQKRVLVIESQGGKLIVHGSKMTPEEYCHLFIGAPEAANNNSPAKVSDNPKQEQLNQKQRDLRCGKNGSCRALAGMQCANKQFWDGCKRDCQDYPGFLESQCAKIAKIKRLF